MEVLQRKSRLYELLVLHNYKWYVYCLLKKNMLRSPASTCSYQQISAITCDSLLVALPWGAKMGAKSCSLSQQLVKVNSQCKLRYRFVNTPTVAGSLTSSCSLPGWHLVNSLSLLLFLSPSLFPNPPSFSHPSFPACLGDTWLGLSLIPGRFFFFPADEGFAWQHSTARHEHNKKWRTTCQSPCQCRHEMKSGGEERWVLDSSEGEIKK